MKIDHITNVETSLMDWGEVVAYVEGDAPAVGEGYPAIRIPGIVVLDDGTLAGHMAPKMNVALQELSTRAARG